MCSGGGLLSKKSKRVIYTWTPPDTEDGGDLKLTASQLDHTCAKIENDPNSSLYVITQEKKEAFYLQITYTVQQGTSQNPVKVKKNLLDVNNPFNFEKRKTYLLHLKLSHGSTRSRSSASEDCSVTMSVSSIPEQQRKNLNALGRSANNIILLSQKIEGNRLQIVQSIVFFLCYLFNFSSSVF